ncbi:H-NS histone family protein [Yoonia sp.]|uniref:H-NS histone family protein n=1 Tax=Yoonia sp. TaxID=2212373 RepID=UPI002DFCCA05|nr:H-NS histone family protein [Yoonia sp.]
MNVDLERLSLEELKELQKNLASAIESYKSRQLKEARAALEEKARELGVSIDEVFADKVRKKKAKAKYRHPENASLTWSGRGRQPKWFIELTSSGMAEEKLLVY